MSFPLCSLRQAYLNVVHWVLSLSLLGHQSLALLSEVGAHTLTHGFQSIRHPAEQLIHARQVCTQIASVLIDEKRIQTDTNHWLDNMLM